VKPDHKIHVFINRKKYELDSPEQTGASLKALAGIPRGDVLFLQQPGEDEVITNEGTVILKNGDHLHSQPPADYGAYDAAHLAVDLVEGRAALHPAEGGWSHLVLSGYSLPDGFTPSTVDLLLKLPPTFPEAAPDMFWVCPPVKAPNGCPPRATSAERLLGKDWQRFSWHLAAGAWKPGVSTLRDYMRCVAGRFQRMD
jgi:hypothetical protein